MLTNRFLVVLETSGGDIFIKVLGVLIGLAFLFIGLRFLFRSAKIIQGIQKYKFQKIAPPRKQELLFARIIGVLLVIVGLYFTIAAILSFFPDVFTQ